MSNCSLQIFLYTEIFHRVMDILKSEVKKVEVYSIDEAFLDFSEGNFYQKNREMDGDTYFYWIRTY